MIRQFYWYEWNKSVFFYKETQWLLLHIMKNIFYCEIEA